MLGVGKEKVGKDFGGGEEGVGSYWGRREREVSGALREGTDIVFQEEAKRC